MEAIVAWLKQITIKSVLRTHISPILVYAIHLNLIPHILHTAWHDDTIFYGERLCLVIAQDDLVGTV